MKTICTYRDITGYVTNRRRSPGRDGGWTMAEDPQTDHVWTTTPNCVAPVPTNRCFFFPFWLFFFFFLFHPSYHIFLLSSSSSSSFPSACLWRWRRSFLLVLSFLFIFCTDYHTYQHTLSTISRRILELIPSASCCILRLSTASRKLHRVTRNFAFLLPPNYRTLGTTGCFVWFFPSGN